MATTFRRALIAVLLSVLVGAAIVGTGAAMMIHGRCPKCGGFAVRATGSNTDECWRCGSRLSAGRDVKR